MELHYEAAQIMTRANRKEGSLKTLVYSSNYKNLKQLYALVSECVKYQAVLEEVLSNCDCDLLEEELIKGDNLYAVVLLYEYLIGKGFGRAGFIRKVIVKHKMAVKRALEKTLQNHMCDSLQEIVLGKQVKISINIPRYARVNAVKCTLEETVEQLQAEGWIFKGTLQAESFNEEIEKLSEDVFGHDPLLDDVLVFAPGTDLHNHPLVMSGVLVLQDKASCIPAHVLNPQPNSVVLDCCAAPGNKTCHLASLMGDKGRVIALDRDLKRITTMKSLLNRSGFTCIELIHQDFLTISPNSEDATQIELILVDPSCSGSGMPGTKLCPSDMEVDIRRLESLKRFQISILKHALRFPNAKRIVYSTCSIHQKENEEVVEEVMEHVKEYFQFRPVFPELSECRGDKKFLHHKYFLRLSPENNLTLGFFVACFERIKSAQKTVAEPATDTSANDIAVNNDSTSEKEKHECGDDSETRIEREKHKKRKKRKRKEEKCNDELILAMESRNLSKTSVAVKNTDMSAMCDDDESQLGKMKKKKHKKDKLISANISEKPCEFHKTTMSTAVFHSTVNQIEKIAGEKPSKRSKNKDSGILLNDSVITCEDLQNTDECREIERKKKKKQRKAEQENGKEITLSEDSNQAVKNSSHRKRKQDNDTSTSAEECHIIKKKKKKKKDFKEREGECLLKDTSEREEFNDCKADIECERKKTKKKYKKKQ